MTRFYLAALALGSATASAAPAAAECNRAPAAYAMPAQRLDQAVQQLAHISGCFVKMDLAMVADRRAPALKGRYRPEEALARLVRGTGYTAHSTPEGLAFDGDLLAVTMSQARALRTAVQTHARAGHLSPAQATRLRATLTEVERTVPRQVNAQGMLTPAQKRDAITKLDAVRSAVGPVEDARGWAAFKRAA